MNWYQTFMRDVKSSRTYTFDGQRGAKWKRHRGVVYDEIRKFWEKDWEWKWKKKCQDIFNSIMLHDSCIDILTSSGVSEVIKKFPSLLKPMKLYSFSNWNACFSNSINRSTLNANYWSETCKIAELFKSK